MATMPGNAKSLTGFGEFGIDDKGEKVFFSLVASAKHHATFLASHKGLADTIDYLQRIARRAEERRIAKAPQEDHVQVLEAPPNVIRKGSIMPDTTGRLARLEGTTSSGVSVDIQIEFRALVSLQKRLPDLIEKMRQLQDQSKKGRATT
jgi:hypothetical protein